MPESRSEFVSESDESNFWNVSIALLDLCLGAPFLREALFSLLDVSDEVSYVKIIQLMQVNMIA